MNGVVLDANKEKTSSKSQSASICMHRSRVIYKRKLAISKMLDQRAVIISFTPPPIEVNAIRKFRTTSYPVCPCCGLTMEREYQTYCDRCGQPLAWNLFNTSGISCINSPAEN